MMPKGGAEMGFHFNILLSLEIEGGCFLFFYFLCLRGRPSWTLYFEGCYLCLGLLQLFLVSRIHKGDGFWIHKLVGELEIDGSFFIWLRELRYSVTSHFATCVRCYVWWAQMRRTWRNKKKQLKIMGLSRKEKIPHGYWKRIRSYTWGQRKQLPGPPWRDKGELSTSAMPCHVVWSLVKSEKSQNEYSEELDCSPGSIACALGLSFLSVETGRSFISLQH